MELKYVLDYMKHRKEMEKEGKGSQANVGFIKGLIDKKTADIIAGKAKELRTIEKIEIKREVEADLKKSITRVGLTAVAIGTALGIGFGAGIKIGSALTEGKYEGIEITNQEVNNNQSEIEVNENSFDESLKVDVSSVVQHSEVSKETIENEIENLPNEESVENYLKEMYIKDFNQENHTNYTVEDVRFDKSRYGIEFYKDEAENGDSIVRVKNADYWQEHSNMGLVKVSVDGNLIEQGTIYHGEYQNVYHEDENVIEAKEVNMLGKTLSTGIDYATALKNKEGNSAGTMKTYKDRFVMAVKEYKEEQQHKITTNQYAQNNDELDQR